MAKVGISAFTAQEAANMKSFSDWNYEELSFYVAGEGTSDTAAYITDANPAKKVVLYQIPTADGTGSLAAANKMVPNGVAQFEAEASNFLLELYNA